MSEGAKSLGFTARSNLNWKIHIYLLSIVVDRTYCTASVTEITKTNLQTFIKI